VPIANRLMPRFDTVVATQDWHPPDHGSFASQHPGKKPGDVIRLRGLRQELWPDHCVQGTKGAAFHKGLDGRHFAEIFRKGTDPGIDSYSAFYDNAHRKSTGLGEYLRRRGISEVCLLGLATDYCVKFSALDAVQLGLDTRVIEDGCRGIDLQPGDIGRAWDEMRRAGAKIVQSSELLGQPA